jgi:ppGpp synthetase/RelA/SpoT-type nucleotidyltranferase
MPDENNADNNRDVSKPAAGSADGEKKAAAERLVTEYGLDPTDLRAVGIEPELLAAIDTDYRARIEQFRIQGDFVVRMLQTVPAVHSLKLRVKDPIHLLKKIVRKRRDKPKDASVGLTDASNYMTEITDLIGVRALHLYKGDWLSIHKFITTTWKLAEQPVAYIRKGDAVVPEVEAACSVKEHPRAYRSIHYVITLGSTSEPVPVEIQVRTLIEEAWSEIDHTLNYPATANPLIGHLLRIFNGFAGHADELGTFIARLHLALAQERAEREAIVGELQQLRAVQTSSRAEKEILEKTIEHLRESRYKLTASGTVGKSSPASLTGLLSGVSAVNALDGLNLTGRIPDLDVFTKLSESIDLSSQLAKLDQATKVHGLLSGFDKRCSVCGTPIGLGPSSGGKCLSCSTGLGGTP